MLVQQWAILQTPMPQGISIQKTIALVIALAKLHNFCIDKNKLDMLELAAEDNFQIVNNKMGFVPLEESTNWDVPIQVQILDGGNHFDNFSSSPSFPSGSMMPPLPCPLRCHFEMHLFI
jgi:hypothetical protein